MASKNGSSPKSAVLIAPLRRRLLQVRAALNVLSQCLGSAESTRPAKTKKRKLEDDDDAGLATPSDDDPGRTCVLPVVSDEASSPELTVSPSESPQFSRLNSLAEEEQLEKPVTAENQTSASVVVEPLRPPRPSYLASRANRTFLLRKAKAALSKVKHASETPSAASHKPVPSSGRARFGRRTPSAAPSSSSSSSSRGQFSGGKASLSGCLMTFVIFTNGSSTRMWFLVSRQPESESGESGESAKTSKNKRRQPPQGRRGQLNRQRDPHRHDRPLSSSSNSSSSSSRRHNASSPPSHSQSSEKKRGVINRFLYEEDGKCTGIEGRSRLAIAASWACPAAIRLLLRRGVPVNSVDSRGKAALHYIAYGHSSVEAVVECLLLLLDAGAQVNCFDDELNTPLHLAALAGCGPAMGLLLRRGADSSVPNLSGRTPVFNFLNNAFNAENVPGLIEMACGSPYAFTGAFRLTTKLKTPAPLSQQPNQLQRFSRATLFDSSPSARLIDCSGQMPLVLKLTLQPSLMPVHVDESLVLSSQFKELLCLFATCPPSLQLLATYSIRNTILDALHTTQQSASSPSTDSLKAAASVIDLPNSLKSFLFA